MLMAVQQKLTEKQINNNPRTVILGAGITGLTAGYLLAKRDYDVEIIERAPVIGGLARSVLYKNKMGNFIFDTGGHRFFTRRQEVNKFISDLMKNELIKVPRKSRYFLWGKWIDYPLTMKSVWN